MITLGSQSLQEGSVDEGYTFTGNVAIYADAIAALLAAPARSVGYAASATVLALLLGYPLAYFMALKAGRWKNVLLVLVIAPFFTSFLIRTLAWRTILADTGWVTDIAQATGFTTLLQAVGLTNNDTLLASKFAVIVRPDLQLPAVHDPAPLHQSRAPGPPPGRGRRRPLRLALAGLPARHLAAVAARAWWRARC